MFCSIGKHNVRVNDRGAFIVKTETAALIQFIFRYWSEEMLTLRIASSGSYFVDNCTRLKIYKAAHGCSL